MLVVALLVQVVYTTALRVFRDCICKRLLHIGEGPLHLEVRWPRQPRARRELVDAEYARGHLDEMN